MSGEGGQRTSDGLLGTDAFDVQLLGFAELAAMGTLRHRPPLSFDCDERAVQVLAGAGAMPLDAGGTGVFLAISQHHLGIV